MKFITVTHANTGKNIDVVVALLFAYYYSDSHKATLLLASGGAMIPVLQTVEEVRERLQI